MSDALIAVDADLDEEYPVLHLRLPRENWIYGQLTQLPEALVNEYIALCARKRELQEQLLELAWPQWNKAHEEWQAEQAKPPKVLGTLRRSVMAGDVIYGDPDLGEGANFQGILVEAGYDMATGTVAVLRTSDGRAVPLGMERQS